MGIHVKTGDITKERACAIVNAANSSLMGGGGVDGAIHRAGGPAILEACREIRRTKYPDGLPTGEAVATTAGDLPAKYVVHTVGPIWGRCGDRCDELLANAYGNSLKVAAELGCDSVVFPAISTGVYGFPPERAAQIAYRTVREFLKEHPGMEVTFIFHSPQSREIFERANGLL
ncbi:O-acetyl-ADP-ribose deacetylase [Hydrogenimonas cancrithermarum]|uniref:O-acetyl-ADP-ribose deacetylase n=1 Tax=Hydrogenimonas cancrithermarum TaxID=2993563 RepID=A0ABM8FND3_9BACT|nr:O-acetyl-ADP-ribose deacetylase [Hydrogenimonas cancrithermarum]BDY13269.1 O-acetyl-ADP-ribose deacetylase [Hydrogenimonas cancrithermarum]